MGREADQVSGLIAGSKTDSFLELATFQSSPAETVAKEQDRDAEKGKKSLSLNPPIQAPFPS